MTELPKNITDKVGLSPGSLIHIGDVLEAPTCISIINYCEEFVDEQEIQSLDEILKYKDSKAVTWIIVEGLKNIDVIEKVGEIFGIHHLVLEDILNTNQRPKLEDYNDYLYIVIKSIVTNTDENFNVSYEQISLLMLNKIVITFKEKKDNLFQPIRQRIHSLNGRLRCQSADYLTYAILDTIVDHCFILVDSLDDAIASLEDTLINSEPTKNILYVIQKLKREIINIRRYISPIRELMSTMLHSESNLIHEKTYIYLRDISDHVVRIIESIEVYREILSNLHEIYVSNIGNKMNEVMKVLTIFASIFIPLTFLVGIYGMNFEYMPELKWKWAYPILWFVFIAIPIVLLGYFKKKKWL